MTFKGFFEYSYQFNILSKCVFTRILTVIGSYTFCRWANVATYNMTLQSTVENKTRCHTAKHIPARKHKAF